MTKLVRPVMPKNLRNYLKNDREAAEFFRQYEEYEVSLVERSNGYWEQANTDHRTGLYNDRYFRESMGRIWEEADEGGDPFALVLLDVDNFKHFNDTYGHPAGDELFYRIGDMLQNTVRKRDIACRDGGDEFAVIAPSTDIERGRKLAERIRRRVRKIDYKEPVTLSAGVAVYRKEIHSADDLFKLADQSLYHAKRSGRDMVSTIEDLREAAR